MSITKINVAPTNNESSIPIQKLVTNNPLTEPVQGITLKPITVTGELPITKEVPLSPIALDDRTPTEIFNEIRQVSLSAFGNATYTKEDDFGAFKKLNTYLNEGNSGALLADITTMLSTTYVMFDVALRDNDSYYRTRFEQTALSITLLAESLEITNGNVQANYAFIQLTAQEIRSEVGQQITDANGILLTEITNIVQNAQGITLSAVSDQLDAFGNHISQNYASLSVFNDQISLLVNSNEFNVLGDIVESHSSAILQSAEAISMRVTTDTFNALGDVVSSHSASTVIFWPLTAGGTEGYLDILTGLCKAPGSVLADTAGADGVMGNDAA